MEKNPIEEFHKQQMQIPEEVKQRLNEEIALFVAKTGVRESDAIAFMTRTSTIVVGYVIRGK